MEFARCTSTILVPAGHEEGDAATVDAMYDGLPSLAEQLDPVVVLLGVWGAVEDEPPPLPQVGIGAVGSPGADEPGSNLLRVAKPMRSAREAPLKDFIACSTRKPSALATWEWGERGYHPARRVTGRNRHALTDTEGCILLAGVSPADVHDSHGGVALWPFLAHCFADRALEAMPFKVFS